MALSTVAKRIGTVTPTTSGGSGGTAPVVSPATDYRPNGGAQGTSQVDFAKQRFRLRRHGTTRSRTDSRMRRNLAEDRRRITVVVLRRGVLPIALALLGAGCGDGGGDREETVARERETTTAESAPVRARGDRLVATLRRGGYVLYFRHAATDPVPDDADPVVFSDCDTQRNLSAGGRRQARAVARAIARLDVPIGRVLASPFCRALDTARLAFGRATRAPVLENLETAEGEAEREARIAGLRRLLATRPERANLVLVAHGFNVSAAADVTIDEGEAAIFRPRPPDGFTLVATVAPRHWEALARRLGTERPAVVREYAVPPGSAPHDVAPAADGTVWYTAQAAGELGRLDPATGNVERVPLGEGSAPHGVIIGRDGAAWVTDGGLNAIVRVDARTHAVRRFVLPGGEYANLNTATFDRRGVLWFTGQSGIYGRVDPSSGRLDVFDAPRGEGPYGITTTPRGDVYYASLAGSHIARIDSRTGRATVIEPPTERQGARRIWSDSRGRLWISEWDAGQLGRYDPASDSWREWRLPGRNPQPYAVYVDERDQVWLSDFGANALVRFDPDTERFTRFALPSEPADVRQLLGRPGEVWGAESAADALVVVRAR
jgi:virginiamycin B lyase